MVAASGPVGSRNLACAICLDEIVLDKDVSQLDTTELTALALSRLPCNHIYHRVCIDSWRRESNTCPMDRSPITDETHNPGPLFVNPGLRNSRELITAAVLPSGLPN